MCRCREQFRLELLDLEAYLRVVLDLDARAYRFVPSNMLGGVTWTIRLAREQTVHLGNHRVSEADVRHRPWVKLVPVHMSTALLFGYKVTSLERGDA